jgi:N-acetylmuramoyl-L-alanine amidase
MPVHEASSTDCLNSIGRRYGFFWETLWNLPENRELRDLRKDPTCLHAGDRVFVPDPRPRTETGATETRHRFRRKGVPARLKLRLKDEEGGPGFAGKRWVMDVDGRHHEGAVSPEGDVELPLVPGAAQATLLVGEGDEQQAFELALGALDPVDTPRGAQQRLRNLALQSAEPADEWTPVALEALRDFQRLYVIKDDEQASGEYDRRTQDALAGAYEDARKASP